MTSPAGGAFREGVLAGEPLLLGVIPFGIIYGAVATEHGFSPWWGMGMSLLVFV